MKKDKETYKLPEGWIDVTLGDILVLEYGKSLPKKDRVESGKYKVYGSNGVIGNHINTIVDGPVIIVGRKGSVGKVQYEKEKCWPIDTTYYIKTSISLCDKYIYHLLSSLNLGSLDSSTAIPGINRNQVYDVKVSLPPLKEQRRIVSKIESLFSELDEAEKRLQKVKYQLKVYRQALLKSAFEGKLTEIWRRDNNTETVVNLLEKVQEQRQIHFEQEIKVWEEEVLKRDINGRKTKKPTKPKEPYSAPVLTKQELTKLAPIPKEWTWVKTSQVISVINNGYTPKSNFLSEGFGEIPFIKVYNLTFNGVLDFNVKPTYIPKENHVKDLKRSICYPNDVLINIVGPPLGKVAIVPEFHNEWNINQAIVLFRPNSFIISKYISFFMQYSKTIQWLTDTAIGTAGQRNIKVSTCREIPILFMSIEEQYKIVELLDSAFSIKEKLEETIKTCSKKAVALRQSILKTAFEGKLIEQLPSDIPAVELLKDIKKEKSVFLKEKKTIKKQITPKKKDMSKALSIKEVLELSDKPMSAKEVWQESKHKNNIEDFYAELKELGDKVVEIKEGLNSLLSLK